MERLKKCSGCIRRPQPIAEFMKNGKELKSCAHCRDKGKTNDEKRMEDPATRERNPDYYKVYKTVKPGYVASQLETKARDRGIEWLLRREDVEAMVQLPCLYCGALDPAHLNGIDRMDNVVGYTDVNCAPCCRTCNVMKKTMDCKTFVARCGHLSHRHGGQGKPSPASWPEYAAKTTIAAYKSTLDVRNAKRVKRGDELLEFQLDADALNAIRNAPCTYCGLGERNGVNRVDSAVGYVASNCVPCCTECSYMKNAFSVQEFLDKCKEIAAREGQFAFPDVATSIVSAMAPSASPPAAP